ncbi:class C beta-lactamase-related serine hydrolase [Cereibacter sphaeroides]|uniref:serine hydrolase domain-containing protein n=1 Tax=Cereibacter sphaeroides TaxID=1063 RepID=UPI000F5226A0|nr:serine hydrolase [Cereibacter sphaeroides]AZB55958.1 class C beta-lactamase-related serine hydrolase [Cereibacter sphaeroides]AZB60218.1 class C beta-lactamase-related serine hydrolase [Cereibacter sphaeroides]
MILSRRLLIAAGAALALPRALRAQAPRRPPLVATLEAAHGLDQLHAIVVAQGGETLVAEALRGPHPDRAVNVKSVSKTLVAALLGAALDRGAVPALGATLGEVAPGLIPAEADPRVRDLTLEDLVTMRAGLERTSGGNYGAWVSSRNWLAYALSRPMVAEPGTRMLYSTGSFHILGAALSEATDRSLLALMRDWLGRPLGIEIPPWTQDPQGFYLGGNEMALSPLALLRFGEMVRQGGRWDGEQVLSADWVRRSLEPRTRSPFSGLGYGYGWFVGRAGTERIALARGYGGQLVCLLPDLGATVVVTSDPTRPARSEGYFGDLMRLIGEVAAPELRRA